MVTDKKNLPNPSKVLLVQPPNGRAYEIPFGSIPALTGALRNNGYEVIQRDLNVEIQLQLLNPEVGTMIQNRIQKKLDSIRSRQKKEAPSLLSKFKFLIAKNERLHHTLIRFYKLFISEKVKEKDERFVLLNFLKFHLKEVAQIIPTLEYFKNTIEKETDEGRYSYDTHEKFWKIYGLFSKTISYLSSPSLNQKSIFDQIENKNTNLYYELYQPFIDSIHWDEIQMLGITVTRRSAIPSLTLANMIKTTYPNIHIVLGGHLFSIADINDNNDLTDLKYILNRYADKVVLFEGDTAIVKIMECLIGKNQWKNVPNLVYLQNDHLEINTPLIYEKTDKLHTFDFDGLPIKYYPGLPVEVSRGCYWTKCSFCRHYHHYCEKEKFDQNIRYYRPVNADKIINDIKFLKQKYNKRNFQFTCLDISPPEIEKISRMIIDEKLDITWDVRVRLDKSLKPELLDLMKEAGIAFFHLAPETFCKHTAELLNKGYDIDHLKELIDYWTKNKDHLPPVMVNIFTGFPGETFQDFMETYQYIMNGEFDTQSIGRFSVTKLSEVYFNPEKYGLEIKKIYKNDAIFRNFEVTWNKKYARERKKIVQFLIRNSKEIENHCRHWTGLWESFYEL